MHGFIVTISLNEKSIQDLIYQWKSTFEFQGAHVIRNFRTAKIHLEQFTSEKFIQEKLWIDNEDFFIVTDGLITNTDRLCRTHNVTTHEQLIRVLSNTQEDFFQAFTGNFVGFYWNKQTNTLLAFNNHTGTKKLFYFKSSEYILFSTDLYTLSQALSHLQISKSLDIEAAYLLLTSGFMHDDYTLIKEVKQVIAGQYATITDKQLTIRSYFNLKDIEYNTDSEEEIINKLDALFTESIQTEFEFEKKYPYTPLTTLSGGLDSRMVALFAHDLNYHHQELFGFSEAGYADEIIAKEIANTYQMKLHQIPLTPRGLMAIEDVVAVNDGLTLYSGAGHAFEAIKKLTIPNIGLIHTGILGDGFMGSYQNSKSEIKSYVSDGGYSISLIGKASKIIENSIAKYRNEEIYKFYNRAFLGINNGFLFFDLLGASVSAFTYPSFAKYAFSIPRSIKYDKKIYIDWIKTKHPEYAHFVWESIGGKPTNNQFIRQYYRYKRAIIKRLPIKSMWKNNMNPEQLWYDENAVVKEYLDGYFKDHIHQFTFHKVLMDDMIQLYTTGNITEKTQVLTLLAAYKLLF